MKTDDLREAYLSFFESKGCVRKPSDLLVPVNDPSVLFTPAGMNQFKGEFLGVVPLEFTRAVTCQKCVRTGDIENVGKTRFHFTMFEMLGNFSFGDYFKREAIAWGWEFCTKVLGIKGDRLRITVYQDDDEAEGIWTKEIGVKPQFVKRCGEDDNFWPASAPSQGPDGVCGPCSEIYVDLGDGREVEIWNLVFTQFNRVGPPPNNLHPLPKKNIDTGMGLERTAAVLQGVPTAYDIDIFAPIVRHAAELLGVKYDPEGDVQTAQRLRRIAEHARTVLFAMHENVQPGPAKQGYVVRRLLRRALVDAYRMGRQEPILHHLVPTIVAMMKKPYPELAGNATSVAGQIAAEEKRFLQTVDRGLAYLDNLFKKSEKISGKDAFELHATYGFPIDLTVELAAARGAAVDRAGFDAAFEKHQETSGSIGSGDVFTLGPVQKLRESGVAVTKFTGYGKTSGEGTIRGVIVDGKLAESAAAGARAILVLDQTPFYAEAGGQVGDVGVLKAEGFEFAVKDVKKTDGFHEHLGVVKKGTAVVGLHLKAEVDGPRRAGIERAHSATHVLHAGLHQVVGEHAKQAGSRVERDQLRFDFSHGQALAPSELKAIEDFATARIMEAAPIEAKVMPIAEAKKLGAMALFGEKYGDEVRVVSMGGFSREFCGGCHLSNTGQVGPLRIVREESVSAGIRRITALVGPAAVEHQAKQERTLHEAAALLRAAPTELPKRIEALQKELKDLQKELSGLKRAGAGDLVAQLAAAAEKRSAASLVVGEAPGAGPDELRNYCDELRAKLGVAAILLVSAEGDDKVHLVASVAKELHGSLKAGDWIKTIAPEVDGKGGGRPDLAAAGGKSPAKIPAALAAAKSFAQERLK
ncbi:MAG TPA: alanine--tRNA ligase [Planctomycetia bacterium]|nr:alanine--tRNA ligase [Planctomycetia bacterium]